MYPGTTGMFFSSSFAPFLLPIAAIVLGGGPMKINPASRHASALEWTLTAAGCAAFLVLYFWGFWQRGPRVLWGVALPNFICLCGDLFRIRHFESMEFQVLENSRGVGSRFQLLAPVQVAHGSEHVPSTASKRDCRQQSKAAGGAGEGVPGAGGPRGCDR